MASPLAAMSPARLILLLLPSLVGADLPVHCLRHEIVGEWRFTLGRLRPERTSCGHSRPDLEESQPGRHIVEEEVDLDGENRIMVTMKQPNSAVTARDSAGTWTMVYDEGFEVTVGGMNFFAFSNFTLQKNASDPLHRYNQSHCGYTMVGWYQNMDRTKFGCYYAEKVEQESAGNMPPRAPEPIDTSTTTPAAPPKENVLSKIASTFEKPLDPSSQDKKVEKLKQKLSLLELGWKARAHEKWNGKTMREVNRYAGIRRDALSDAGRADMLHQRSSAHDHSAGHSLRRSFLQRQASSAEVAARIVEGDMPESFDWSNVSGRSYLEEVMDQGDCGSCYAASSMRMLTARHKIQQNNTEAIPWSINFPLFCSEYTQGCKGGYGTLTAKWSGDVGLLPATCMRYNTRGSCNLECNLDELKGKRFRAANHRYVGNWYGNTSVQAIKAELWENGPLVLGLEPSEDFMFYSEGIYKSVPHAEAKLATQPSAEPKEWEKVDHAVLLVGWGQENGQKYWRLQNSWGPDWGEDGFFRIAMGVNEASIESIAEAADVVEDEQHGKQVGAFFASQMKSTIVEKVLAAPIDGEKPKAKTPENSIATKAKDITKVVVKDIASAVVKDIKTVAKDITAIAKDVTAVAKELTAKSDVKKHF